MLRGRTLGISGLLIDADAAKKDMQATTISGLSLKIIRKPFVAPSSLPNPRQISANSWGQAFAGPARQLGIPSLGRVGLAHDSLSRFFLSIDGLC